MSTPFLTRRADLAGKAILITGAGQGLGRAYALDIARHGASVLVNDVDASTAADVVADIRAAGGHAEADVRAIGSADAGKAVVDACVNAFGRIDGLINNAGIFTQALPWELPTARAEEIIRVNLLGVIHTGVEALRLMREAGQGAIVNIVSGSMFGLADFSIYGATKGGVLSLTYAWAKAVEGTAIHVHALSPLAMTAMMKQSSSGPFSTTTPEEVAPLASYLVSDRARRLNGQVIRLTSNRLHLLRAAEFSAPLAEREIWDMEAIDAALRLEQ